MSIEEIEEPYRKRARPTIEIVSYLLSLDNELFTTQIRCMSLTEKSTSLLKLYFILN